MENNSLINDTTNLTKYSNNKVLLESIEYAIDNEKNFYKNFTILMGSYIKDVFISKLKTQLKESINAEPSNEKKKISYNNGASILITCLF